jgi:3-hydroxymyristoyl/3-hydroxydecanoyl-(acyl carrier protein) dehydratase
MSFEVQRAISARHPSLPGHFPGNPIVPGVVILDEVVTALGQWRDGYRLTRISAVKFLAPLKPEQPFTIVLSALDPCEGRFDFFCRTGDRIVVQGRLEADRRPS